MAKHFSPPLIWLYEIFMLRFSDNTFILTILLFLCFSTLFSVKSPFRIFISGKGSQIHLFRLHKTSYRSNRSVCSIIADLDAISGIGCMDNLSISHINCNMSAIADQVAWLSIRIGYFISGILLLIRCSWKTYAKVCIYTLHKARAVSTTGKACSTPYIWVYQQTCVA